jgi:hypothetical protein
MSQRGQGARRPATKLPQFQKKQQKRLTPVSKPKPRGR